MKDKARIRDYLVAEWVAFLIGFFIGSYTSMGIGFLTGVIGIILFWPVYLLIVGVVSTVNGINYLLDRAYGRKSHTNT